jgi:hypothetical protein
MGYLLLNYKLWIIYCSTTSYGLFTAQPQARGYLLLNYKLGLIYCSTTSYGLFTAQLQAMGYFTLMLGYELCSLLNTLL